MRDITRKNHRMAASPFLFRAELISMDPDGNTFMWYEGPYLNDHVARGRITFWRNHYAHDPDREGWSVDGHVQTSEMTWGNI